MNYEQVRERISKIRHMVLDEEPKDNIIKELEELGDDVLQLEILEEELK